MMNYCKRMFTSIVVLISMATVSIIINILQIARATQLQLKEVSYNVFYQTTSDIRISILFNYSYITHLPKKKPLTTTCIYSLS